MHRFFDISKSHLTHACYYEYLSGGIVLVLTVSVGLNVLNDSDIGLKLLKVCPQKRKIGRTD